MGRGATSIAGELLLLLILSGVTRAQSPSIRPSSAADRGGRAVIEGNSYRVVNMSLARLVIIAYGLQPYQFSGPAWMQGEHFDMTAPLPPGTSQSQARNVLRNLLEQRFHLTVHRGQKERMLFELTVGPGGSKLEPAGLGPAAPEPDRSVPGETGTREPGLPAGLPGHTAMAIGSGFGRLRMYRVTMGQLVHTLEGSLGEPVIDVTGLKGAYDFTLNWSGVDPASGTAALKSAVRNQLGLQLERKKGPIDVLIVDHADKRPTKN